MPIQIDNLKGERVRDPYKNKERFSKHFAKKISLLTPINKRLVTQYIEDMLSGRNVTGKKGRRGYSHLNTLLSRLILLTNLFSSRYNKDLTQIEENELHEVFSLMREGKISKSKGNGRYKSVHDYIRIFKAYWNWYIKVQRKEGNDIKDITFDLSGAAEHKPDFVYFNFESVKKMVDYAQFDYKVLMIFLFDSSQC